MKNVAKYRVLLWLALLFSCGAVFGYYVATRLTPPNGQNSSQGRALENNWRARRTESLRRALDLTDEQLRDMAPAFDRAEESLRRLREETAVRYRERRRPRRRSPSRVRQPHEPLRDLTATQASLAWTGAPRVRLQKATDLRNPVWQDVAGTAGMTNATDPRVSTPLYYRAFLP
jgi:TolA-binding protein